MRWFGVFVLIVCIVFGVALSVFHAWYVSGLFGNTTSAEESRTQIDDYLKQSDASPTFLSWAIQQILFRNGDKYVFRPPRIVPGHTIQGSIAYMAYGMVESWDPSTSLLVVNSYSGKNNRTV